MDKIEEVESEICASDLGMMMDAVQQGTWDQHGDFVSVMLRVYSTLNGHSPQ